MNKLMLIILVLFCITSVLSKSIKVSSEDDDENSENSNQSDEDEVPQIDSQFIPKNFNKFIRKNDKNYESKDFFQGDINLDDDDEDELFDESDEGGTGWRNKSYHWPKKGEKVIVPYEIDDDYSDAEKKNIQLAMTTLQSETGCLQFTERSNEIDYIFVTRESAGCWSRVGKKGGEQILNIGFGCSQVGTIMHEFIHALGFLHMQAHTQRDKFIKIVEENVIEEFKRNFKTYSEKVVTSYNTPYDYFSIMHYPPDAFSKNGKKTILTIDPKMDEVIGQRNSLSPGDIIRIQKMYGCPVTTSDESEYDESDEEEQEEDVNESEEEDE